jgi:hypothetical protein
MLGLAWLHPSLIRYRRPDPLTASATRLRFFAQSLEAARNVPGVTTAGLTSQLPMSGNLEREREF